MASSAFVSLHVRRQHREPRDDHASNLGQPVTPKFGSFDAIISSEKICNLARSSKIKNGRKARLALPHPFAYLRPKPKQFPFLTDGILSQSCFLTPIVVSFGQEDLYETVFELPRTIMVEASVILKDFPFSDLL